MGSLRVSAFSRDAVIGTPEELDALRQLTIHSPDEGGLLELYREMRRFGDARRGSGAEQMEQLRRYGRLDFERFCSGSMNQPNSARKGVSLQPSFLKLRNLKYQSAPFSRNVVHLIHLFKSPQNILICGVVSCYENPVPVFLH
jgi:hypothetical protein